MSQNTDPAQPTTVEVNVPETNPHDKEAYRTQTAPPEPTEVTVETPDSSVTVNVDDGE